MPQIDPTPKTKEKLTKTEQIPKTVLTTNIKTLQ